MPYSICYHSAVNNLEVMHEKQTIQKFSVHDVKKESKSLMAFFIGLEAIVSHTSHNLAHIDIQISGFSTEYENIFSSFFLTSRSEFAKERSYDDEVWFLNNLFNLKLILTNPKTVNLKHRLTQAIKLLFSVIENVSMEPTVHDMKVDKSLPSINDIFHQATKVQNYNKHNKSLPFSENSTHKKVNKKINGVKKKSVDFQDQEEKVVAYYKPYQKRKFQYLEYNLFADASVKPHAQTSSIGGYIKHLDESVVEFRKTLEYSVFWDNNLAECYSIWYGLIIAKDMGVHEIKVFTDSQFAVNCLTKDHKVPAAFQDIIFKIKAVLLAFHYKIEHIPRHHNALADELSHILAK